MEIPYAFIGGWGNLSIEEERWEDIYKEVVSRINGYSKEIDPSLVIYFDQSYYSFEFLKRYSERLRVDSPVGTQLVLRKYKDNAYLLPYFPEAFLNDLKDLKRQGLVDEALKGLARFDEFKFMETLFDEKKYFDRIEMASIKGWYDDVYFGADECKVLKSLTNMAWGAFIFKAYTSDYYPIWDAQLMGFDYRYSNSVTIRVTPKRSGGTEVDWSYHH